MAITDVIPAVPEPVEKGLRIFDLAPQPWMDAAACRGLDPALFFAERGDHQGTVAAKMICARCPVLVECGAYAATITNPAPGIGLPGVWAGLSERDRRETPIERTTHRRQMRPSRPDLDYPPATEPDHVVGSYPVAAGTVTDMPRRFRQHAADHSLDGPWLRHSWSDSMFFAPKLAS